MDRAPVPADASILCMSTPATDPTKWFTDLIKSQDPMVLWPVGDVAETSAAIAAAAAPWTKAVADITQWQLSALQAFTAPFTAAMPGLQSITPPLRTGVSPVRLGARIPATTPSPAPMSPRPT